MEKLSQQYTWNNYHLITKNCNHFCNDVCMKLTGKSIPRWVNRLARLGLLCNCVLPAELSGTKILQVRSEGRLQQQEEENGEMKKLRSQSNRFISSCSISPSSSEDSCNICSMWLSSAKGVPEQSKAVAAISLLEVGDRMRATMGHSQE